MTTLTLRLRRPEGVKVVSVEFNGEIETLEERGEPEPSRKYLFEMTPEQRAERLRERANGKATTAV
jgi:hypothetical protein